jgi:hypothetical protein
MMCLLQEHQLVTRIADINLFFGVGGFLPLPSVDGQVIWQELLAPWAHWCKDGELSRKYFDNV